MAKTKTDKPIFLVCFDELYEMSAEQYLKLLEDTISNKDPNIQISPSDYGEFIDSVVDVTNWDKEKINKILELIKDE